MMGQSHCIRNSSCLLGLAVVALASCTRTLTDVEGGTGGQEHRCAFESLATVSGSHAHDCAVAAEGALWCWGANDAGQLGIGPDGTASWSDPISIEGVAPWVSVGVARGHTCSIQHDGSLWCWGDNTHGQLGVGDVSMSDEPVRVDEDADWVRLALGTSHTCGLQSDGSLWCWGSNENGNLGLGPDTPSDFVARQPMLVSTGWSEIDAGTAHTCGIRDDGTLWCWGDNSLRQLGLGSDVQPHYSPELVTADSDWASVSSGSVHSCSLKQSGKLYCWGHNQDGALGHGDDDLQNPRNFVPSQVGLATDWTSVSAGDWRTCGVHGDGSLQCWGQNLQGELGIGDDSPYWSPTQVGTAAWLDVATGGDRTCALRDDSTLWCWGFLLLPDNPDAIVQKTPVPGCHDD